MALKKEATIFLILLVLWALGLLTGTTMGGVIHVKTFAWQSISQ
jgi:hypothetical protein